MSQNTQLEQTDPVEADDQIIGTMFWASIKVFLGILLLMGGGYATWKLTRASPKPPPAVSEVKPPTRRATTVVPNLPLVDVTSESGVTFRHFNGATGQKLLPETMGSGCAFLDYDNDGDQDLLFVNSCSWPWDPPPAGPAPTMELYQNDGHGKFQNVTKETGLDATFYGMGVACGDYDADGWTDLFFTAVGKNHLYRNNQGHFHEVTDVANVGGGESEWSTSAAFFDFDNDGDLDLFVGNYVRWSREIDMVQGFTLDGETRAYGPPTAFDGTFPYLYRNEGNGKFLDVSEAAGVQIKNSSTSVPVAKTMGIQPVDVDGDGWIDIMVANDTVQNFLYMNHRDGTFREIGILCGVGVDANGAARGAMGLDCSYFREKGGLGIAIGNFANEMTALYVSSPKQASFVDEAIATGLGPPTRQELTFGIFFFDCDLDGRLDILANNGHLEQEINKIQTSQFFEQPPHLIWNAGVKSADEYVSVPKEKISAGFAKPLVGRGSAYADWDGDGDQDVVLVGNGGPARLIRNDQQTGHHWLRVKLRGKKENPEAIGARIEVSTASSRQIRIVMPARSYCSQSELPVTFGLGQATRVDELQVTWPNGTKQVVPVDRLDTLLVVKYPL